MDWAYQAQLETMSLHYEQQRAMLVGQASHMPIPLATLL